MTEDLLSTRMEHWLFLEKELVSPTRVVCCLQHPTVGSSPNPQPCSEIAYISVISSGWGAQELLSDGPYLLSSFLINHLSFTDKW